jgi:hypothetical protein
MRQYKILRTWAVVLTALGVATLVAAALGLAWWVISVDGAWQKVGAAAIGTPVVLLLAAGPLALAHGLRALADIGDDMAFESLTTRASSPY